MESFIPDNGFTICGFKSPQKVQWMNGKGKSFKLSDILSIIDMHEMPRIIEIAISWDSGHQHIIILNITKDCHHQYCCFNTKLHAPSANMMKMERSVSDDIDDDYDEYSTTYNDEEKQPEIGDLYKTAPPISMDLQLPTLNDVKREISAPTTYQQCMRVFEDIPVINDHIAKQHHNINHKPQRLNNNDINSNLPSSIDVQKQKTLTQIGECLAVEELFAILCWMQCPKLVIKIQFADLVTIQKCTELILKYRDYFQLDSLSCIWYHGVFLHEFPLSNGRSLTKKVFGTGPSNNLSFQDYTENVKKIPSITYSLSWPTNNMSAAKSAGTLKLCLSSILSEISIEHEHDIIIHFPIQYIYDCYYIINDLITNKSYFPYVAFNFFNIHNNLHNFDFSSYYKFKYDQKNGKNGYHHYNHQNGRNKQQQQQSSSSWSLFGRKQKPKNGTNHLQLPYDTNNPDIRNLKEDQIVCKSDLNWLSSHIHQMFCFTSVSCVRFKNSPNDEFRKILGQHNVPEWSGRLSWNPKANRPPYNKRGGSPRTSSKSKNKKGKKHRKSPSLQIMKKSDINKPVIEEEKKPEILKQPEIDWDLWQLTRLDAKSRHFQSCIYNKNIGLAPRNAGWLISTRELRPPYRIKGRFFTADKTGVLSIYIRCSSIEHPCNNDIPSFGIGVHIGNEKLKIVTYRLQNKQITQQCGIGACMDNGYDFQIIDRGVMYPVVCQVERTGKDGRGDEFPQGKNLQIPYPKDSTQWMYHIVFVNSSNEWCIIDRLIVNEKHHDEKNNHQ